MVTLDSIKGTWMERRVNGIICQTGECISEAETKPVCMLPPVIRKPPERGGISRPNNLTGGFN